MGSLELFSLDGLLTQEQMGVLAGLSGEIIEAWESQTIWRTTTEAKFSVLQDIKFPTKAAKYHQAKKEQLVFFENLVELSFEYRTAQIDLAETSEKLKSSDGFERQRLEVAIDRLNFRIQGMILQARERLREIVMWSDIKKELNDGTFDAKDKDTDQLRALTMRYLGEVPAALKSKNSGEMINIIGQATTMYGECKRRQIDLGPEAKKIAKSLRSGK